MSAADTSDERVRVFVQADDGRAFVAVFERLEAGAGDPLDMAGVELPQQLARRVAALTCLADDDLQDVVDTLSAYSDETEWQAIVRVLTAADEALPGIGQMVEKSNGGRLVRRCRESAARLASVPHAKTDELEALAKAALEELRHRGLALAIEGDRAHIADALNACERLAASARAVEQIARAAPANEGG